MERPTPEALDGMRQDVASWRAAAKVAEAEGDTERAADLWRFVAELEQALSEYENA
jgi:hypothetical protein